MSIKRKETTMFDRLESEVLKNQVLEVRHLGGAFVASLYMEPYVSTTKPTGVKVSKPHLHEPILCSATGRSLDLALHNLDLKLKEYTMNKFVESVFVVVVVIFAIIGFLGVGYTLIHKSFFG